MVTVFIIHNDADKGDTDSNNGTWLWLW
jgi:hypothetical protein